MQEEETVDRNESLNTLNILAWFVSSDVEQNRIWISITVDRFREY